MTIKSFIISSAIIFIIGFMMAWSIKPEKKCPEPNTLIEYRYIEKTDTLIVPKFKTIIKKDTVKYSDTVFIHQETQYIASVDTTYEDSSLTAHVQYVSPIPLSHKSYFNLKFGVREKTVTNTIIQKEEWGFFHKRFVPILGVGVVYTWDGQMNLGAFLGLGVRLN